MNIDTTYEIPAFPVTVMHLLRELTDGVASLNEIAEIVQEDIAISSKLLAVANTPSYRARREIETIGHAVSWLGKEATAAISLSISMSTLIQEQQQSQESFRKLWLHSFVQGIAMEEIAYLTKKWNTNKAYIAGLLMDIGQLAQLTNQPRLYADFHRDEQPANAERLAREIELFGRDYVDIGTGLIESMNLPTDFGLVAEMHLSNIEQIEQISDTDQRSLVAAAAVASEIGDYFCSEQKVESLLRIHRIASRFLDIEPALIDQTLESIEVRARAKAEANEVDVTNLPSTRTLTGLAVEQLSVKLLRNSVPLDPCVETMQLRKECEMLREQLREAEERACRESLTNCYNREYLEGRLIERVRHSRVTGTRFGILMIDVDDFKLVNDSHGHLAGDDVLVDLSQAMHSLPQDDLAVCRYGGDEFVILMSEEEAGALKNAADMLFAKFSELRAERTPQSVDLSIGGVIAQPMQGDDSTHIKILQAADRAMYESKTSNGNGILVTYWPSSQESPTKQPVAPIEQAGPADTCAIPSL